MLLTAPRITHVWKRAAVSFAANTLHSYLKQRPEDGKRALAHFLASGNRCAHPRLLFAAKSECSLISFPLPFFSTNPHLNTRIDSHTQRHIPSMSYTGIQGR